MNQNDLLQIELDLAAKAERLRNNLLGEYFKTKREQYFAQFVEASPEEIMNIKYRLEALLELEADIQSIIDGGKVAAATIAKRENLN